MEKALIFRPSQVFLVQLIDQKVWVELVYHADFIGAIDHALNKLSVREATFEQGLLLSEKLFSLLS